MESSYFTPEILKFDFFDTAVADILRAIDGGSILGSYILGFCCIDYMGVAYDPRVKNTSTQFKLFVKEYMGETNSEYKILSEHIWAVRNSLVHSYGVSDATEKLNLIPRFSHLHPELHLTLTKDDGKEVLHFNLPEFIAELVAAVELFFREKIGLNDNSVIWQLKLFATLGLEANINRKEMLFNKVPPHSKSHRHLKILEQPDLDIRTIQTTILKNINEQYGR